MENNTTLSNQAVVAHTILIGKDQDAVVKKHPVSGIVISKLANKIPTARVTFNDGDTTIPGFPISDLPDYLPGESIEIRIGAVGNEVTVFKGVIVKHGIRIRNNGASVLVIDCRDVFVKTTLEQKNRYFHENTTDDQAIKELIKAYNDSALQFSIEATAPPLPGLVQYNCTDWDFIAHRAELNGQLLLVSDGILSTVSPALKNDPAPPVVGYGSNILEFEAEIDPRNQRLEISGVMWQPDQQKLLKAEVEKPQSLLDTPGNLGDEFFTDLVNSAALTMQNNSQLTAEELKLLLKAELIKSRLARVVGRVKTEGRADIQPGSTIELKGVGERFSGLAYVTGIRHEIGNGLWTTDIQFGLSREWFSFKSDSRANRSSQGIPPMEGLHIGIVTRLEGDPLNQDRIKLTIPVINETGEGVWARISRPDAGAHRGIFFLPQIGDEVLVGFLNGDPRVPLVLGMLHSSAHPAPLTAQKEDNRKGFYSTKGHRIEFDDAKGTIKIQSLSADDGNDLGQFREEEPDAAKNNTILVDDQNGSIVISDKNQNTIGLDASGIRLESTKNVTIKGKNVSIEASGTLTASGNSGTEIKSGGATAIKGATVNLN